MNTKTLIRKETPFEWAGHAAEMPLIFHHIPKAAGTSIASVLQQWFSHAQILSPEDSLHKTGSHPALALATSRLSLFGVGVHYDGDDILSLVRLFEAAKRKPFIVASIREPRERLISQYLHWRRTDDANLIASTIDAQEAYRLARDMSLVDFLKTGHPYIQQHFKNYQVRLFAGEKSSWMLDDRTQLDLALSNASRYSLIGTSQNNHELIEAIAEAYGFVYRSFDPLLNKAPLPLSEDLGSKGEEVIAEWIGLDLQFWNMLMRSSKPERQESRLKSYYDYSWFHTRSFINNTRCEFTMSSELDGFGWHIREGAYHDTRWTGPDILSGLVIDVPPSLLIELTITIVAVVDWDVINGLEIKLDNTLPEKEAEIGHDGEYKTLSFLFRMGDNKAKKRKLTIRVPFVKSHYEVNPLWNDPRPKGLAISRIVTSTPKPDKFSHAFSLGIDESLMPIWRYSKIMAEDVNTSDNDDPGISIALDLVPRLDAEIVYSLLQSPDHNAMLSKGDIVNYRSSFMVAVASLKGIDSNTSQLARMAIESREFILLLSDTDDLRIKCLVQNPLVSNYCHFITSELLAISLRSLAVNLGVDTAKSLLFLYERASLTKPQAVKPYQSQLDSEYATLLLRVFLWIIVSADSQPESGGIETLILSSLMPECCTPPTLQDLYLKYFSESHLTGKPESKIIMPHERKTMELLLREILSSNVSTVVDAKLLSSSLMMAYNLVNKLKLHAID